jgi:hypothetical protein
MNPHVPSCPAHFSTCGTCTCGARDRVSTKGPQPFRQATFRSADEVGIPNPPQPTSIVETRTTVDKVLSGPLTLEKLRALVKETEDWPDGLVLTRSKEVRTGPTTYTISKSV